MTGIYDEIAGESGGVRYASEAHRDAALEQQAASAKAAKMYPEMTREKERDANGGMYAKMAEQQAQAADEAAATLAIRMTLPEGRDLRNAAREEIYEAARLQTRYPSMSDADTAAKIDAITARFDYEGGNYLVDYRKEDKA